MKTINTRNKTGPGRSPLNRQAELIRTMLDNGATLQEVSAALLNLGVDRAPNTISEWLTRIKNGYRRPDFDFLSFATLRPSNAHLEVRSSKLTTLCPLPSSTPRASVPSVNPASKVQITSAALAALKAKAKKSAEELADRIPQQS